jgi:ATP-binding cassette, subfamily B (MDR/TAP), member 1
MERRPQIDSWSTEGEPVSESGQGQLSFKNVHFRYPTRPYIPVLKGLDFEVEPGQYVAIVGPSGCGKSTAVALVERFYDPTVGSILVDGIPTSQYNLSALRKILGLVSQEPT